MKKFLKKEKIAFFWVNFSLILCLAAALIWEHSILSTHIASSCMFHDRFHLYCPGCGGTRALYLMLHFHPIQSVLYHPIIGFLTVLLLDYDIGAVITLIKKNGKRYYYLREWFCYVGLAVILLNWVLRNLMLVQFHVDYIGDLLKYWV